MGERLSKEDPILKSGYNITEQIDADLREFKKKLPQLCSDQGTYYSAINKNLFSIIHDGFLNELDRMLEVDSNITDEKIDAVKEYVCNGVTGIIKNCHNQYYDEVFKRNAVMAQLFEQSLNNGESKTIGDIEKKITIFKKGRK